MAELANRWSMVSGVGMPMRRWRSQGSMVSRP
jgi:hypothetical protein